MLKWENFKNISPPSQAYSAKDLSQTWESGKLFYQFFCDIKFHYVFQKIFIKKVSQFPTFDVILTASRFLRVGNFFKTSKSFPNLLKSFPPSYNW